MNAKACFALFLVVGSLPAVGEARTSRSRRQTRSEPPPDSRDSVASPPAVPLAVAVGDGTRGAALVGTIERGSPCATTTPCEKTLLDAGDGKSQLWCRRINGTGGSRWIGLSDLAGLAGSFFTYGCGSIEVLDDNGSHYSTGRITAGYCTGKFNGDWPECYSASADELVSQGIGCNENTHAGYEIALEGVSGGVYTTTSLANGGYKCYRFDEQFGWANQIQMGAKCREGALTDCHTIQTSWGDMYCSLDTCPQGAALGSCWRTLKEMPKEAKEKCRAPSKW